LWKGEDSVLIFDFDGVLMNSIKEITVTAYNAVTGKLVTGIEYIPREVVRMFQQNRFHVQAIGDTLCLMRWCMENRGGDPNQILTKEQYSLIVRQEPEPPVDRTKRFFSTRAAFIKKDEMRWLSLNEPYRPLWEELLKLTPERVILLTNKNRDAVMRLCRHFGMTLIEENVYSGDEGVSKFDNLRKIHKRFNRHPYDFIDDSLKNLRDLDRHFNKQTVFIRPMLALWGYTGPRDGLLARKAGYTTFNQHEFIAFIKSEPSVSLTMGLH